MYMYNVEFNLEGGECSRNRDSYSGKKIVFCSIVFDEYMTVAVTRSPLPPLPAQCRKPINIETGRKG